MLTAGGHRNSNCILSGLKQVDPRLGRRFDHHRRHPCLLGSRSNRTEEVGSFLEKCGRSLELILAVMLHRDLDGTLPPGFGLVTQNILLYVEVLPNQIRVAASKPKKGALEMKGGAIL